MSVADNAPKRAREPRRASAAPQALVETPGKRPLVLIAVVALLLGAAIGALGMRTRYRMLEREVVVSVNGDNITRGDFFTRMERAGGRAIITQMVGERLALQYARQKGVFPADADVERRYAELARTRNFQANLKRQGLSPGEVKQQIRIDLARAAVLAQGITVSDADVHAYYNANADPRNAKAKFYVPESTRIAVIVTTSEAHGKEALQELNRGRPFNEVAKQYSVDKSKDAGGVLPPVLMGRTESTKIPELEGAIFGLKVGQTMGPREFAKVRGAWWIIRCLDKSPPQVKRFEEVADQCRIDARLAKVAAANASKVETDFKDFQKGARIQAFWPQYKDAVAP